MSDPPPTGGRLPQSRLDDIQRRNRLPDFGLGNVKSGTIQLVQQTTIAELLKEIKELRALLIAREAETAELKVWLEASRRRERVVPCEICQWPVMNDDCHICECCGHEPICDRGNWSWDGTFWASRFDDSRKPAILKRLEREITALTPAASPDPEPQ